MCPEAVTPLYKIILGGSDFLPLPPFVGAAVGVGVGVGGCVGVESRVGCGRAGRVWTVGVCLGR